MVVRRHGNGVTVDGFLGSTWLEVRWSHRQLDRAIRAGDAAALHSRNPEYAPAWCPTCRASYCRRHWQTDMTVADDHPGWYDATYGTCPEGHTRKLDD
jgi:hypothetical protein